MLSGIVFVASDRINQPQKHVKRKESGRLFHELFSVSFGEELHLSVKICEGEGIIFTLIISLELRVFVETNDVGLFLAKKFNKL